MNKPYHLLQATGKVLSWMIENLDDDHLISDNNSNTSNLFPPKYKERQIMLA